MSTIDSEYIGKRAPDFSLPDQDDVVRTLSEYQGQKLLLYFYPKDLTPGCTLEAEVFRDLHSTLAKFSVAVVGVSADSTRRHRQFRDKLELPFQLLSDTEGSALRDYGVWVEKTMFGKKYMGIARESFLIDEQGNVLKHYRKVSPAKHGEEVLKDLESLKSNSPK
jgi:peroxiredoxin Q/BCP